MTDYTPVLGADDQLGPGAIHATLPEVDSEFHSQGGVHVGKSIDAKITSSGTQMN